MYGRNGSVLVPRNGHTPVVGIVARISGCANQKETSLDDQIDHAKQVLAEMYDGSIEFRIISTKGKGERLDRPELEQIEAELRKDELDVWIMEDIGRVVRGYEAVRLLGIGIDHGARGISPNDFIDTIDPTWEEDALAACRDHVGHNAHTSKRLKHKLMNRFVKFGGAPARPPAGYIVPPGAKTYDDWKKVDEATPIICEGLRILDRTRNGAVGLFGVLVLRTPTGERITRRGDARVRAEMLPVRPRGSDANSSSLPSSGKQFL